MGVCGTDCIDLRHQIILLWFFFLVLGATTPQVGQGLLIREVPYISVSEPPGRGPVPGPGINYTGPREA